MLGSLDRGERLGVPGVRGLGDVAATITSRAEPEQTIDCTIWWCIVWCMTKRLSVTLPDADEQRVEQFSSQGLAREALERRLTRSGAGRVNLETEAAVIRALMEVGVQAVEEEMLEAGYAALAESYSEADDDRRAARRRYTERTEAAL